MSEVEPTWRELYRSDDPDRVRTVATTIAAMGFDIQCADAAGNFDLSEASDASTEDDPRKPPYVVRVPIEHFSELSLALDELLAEQDAFDELLAQRGLWDRRFRRRLVLVALIVLMVALGLLGLLQV